MLSGILFLLCQQAGFIVQSRLTYCFYLKGFGRVYLCFPCTIWEFNLFCQPPFCEVWPMHLVIVILSVHVHGIWLSLYCSAHLFIRLIHWTESDTGTITLSQRGSWPGEGQGGTSQGRMCLSSIIWTYFITFKEHKKPKTGSKPGAKIPFTLVYDLPANIQGHLSSVSHVVVYKAISKLIIEDPSHSPYGMERKEEMTTRCKKILSWNW